MTKNNSNNIRDRPIHLKPILTDFGTFNLTDTDSVINHTDTDFTDFYRYQFFNQF